MKKLLLGTAAVALAATFVASPANAQVKLDVGGYAKLYGVWLDQDETGNDPDTAATDESVDVRAVDFARDTEIHFTGETTLDNGLTVGFHTEAHADASDAGFTATALNQGNAGIAGGGNGMNVEESYAYFSGAWGRVNFGAEDGATYLLQVAAPSADTNYDGLRQYINPIRPAVLTNTGAFAGGATAADNVTIADIFGGGAGSALGAAGAGGIVTDNNTVGASASDVRFGPNAAVIGAMGARLDYDHAMSGYENKLTYMTPVFNGFQGGVSWTPELTSGIGGGLIGPGNNFDDTVGDYGTVWEVAARYEGQWNELGVALGGGWSHAELERAVAVTVAAPCANSLFFTDVDGGGAADCDAGEGFGNRDDREAWNVGVDLDWRAFGLGGGYTEDDNGVSGDALETETWFIGGDYTTGPFKIGISYMDQDQAFASAEVEQDRWTGGVIYTYGPGMTFRGSVSFTDYEEDLGTRTATTGASGDADATSLLLGTQIDF